MIPARELYLGAAFAPWLTRTSGRPVLRPSAIHAAAIRIRALIDALGRAFREMEAAALPAVQAFEAFGAVIWKAGPPVVDPRVCFFREN